MDTIKNQIALQTLCSPEQVGRNFLPILRLEKMPVDCSKVFSNIDEKLLTEFVRALFPEFKNNPHVYPHFTEFLEIMYSSSIGAAQWVGQIIQVYRWLTQQKRAARFADVVQYTSCYLESNSDEPITGFLDQFGFERSTVRK